MNFLLVCCLCFAIGVAGDVTWFGIEGMSDEGVSIATANKVYFGEVSNGLLSLLSSSSLKVDALIPGAFPLFTIPSSTAICVVKSSSSDFKDLLWRSEKLGLVVLGHKNADEVNKNYSPECFSITRKKPARFVPFEPLLPQPPKPVNHPAIQRLLAPAVEPNPVIQGFVDGLSRSNIEKDVQDFSTNYDGLVVNITRNSYSIEIGVGGCADAYWRCLSNVQEDLVSDLHSIMRSSSATYTIDTVSYRNDMGPNIRLIIEGSSTEIVVLGAHLDSRNFGAGAGGFAGLAPGADDNGSGSAINLEIVRSLAASDTKFVNTMHIVWFTGEEQGLFGSRALAKQYAEDGVEVVGMFNNDMVGYTYPPDGVVLSFMNSSRSIWLTESCKSYSQVYIPTLAVGDANACCSDQQSFFENGYPSAGIFETPTDGAEYPEYHTSNDRYDNGLINYDQVYQFGQANFACLLEFAIPA